MSIIVGFFSRWILATIWIAIAFLGLGFTFAILPESTIDRSGNMIVVVWLAIVYLVGHYGIWER